MRFSYTHFLLWHFLFHFSLTKAISLFSISLPSFHNLISSSSPSFPPKLPSKSNYLLFNISIFARILLQLQNGTLKFIISLKIIITFMKNGILSFHRFRENSYHRNLFLSISMRRSPTNFHFHQFSGPIFRVFNH